jgi:predicted metal-dependent hydrolase
MPRLPTMPEVEITLRRSPRARRLSLRVSRQDGRVVLTIPPRAREREALAFLASQEGWLRATLARLPPPMPPLGPGSLIPVEGRPLRLTPAAGRGVRIAGEALLLPGDPARAVVRAAVFLRALARSRLAAACDRHAAALGRPYSRLDLRDPKARWGSCGRDGRLMFSWRLILAPPEVLDYVAAHEVAHLAEMNHAPAFWAVVARLCPGWQDPRAWLKANGATLHGFRFG